jgi:hypothetical protein
MVAATRWSASCTALRGSSTKPAWISSQARFRSAASFSGKMARSAASGPSASNVRGSAAVWASPAFASCSVVSPGVVVSDSRGSFILGFLL